MKNANCFLWTHCIWWLKDISPKLLTISALNRPMWAYWSDVGLPMWAYPSWEGPHGQAHMGRPTWVGTGPLCPCPLATSRRPAAWFPLSLTHSPRESSAQPKLFLANTGLTGIFLIEDEWGDRGFVYLLMVLTGPGPAPLILWPVPWRRWSWVWARPLDEEKERIWRRGNPQSRLLLYKL